MDFQWFGLVWYAQFQDARKIGRKQDEEIKVRNQYGDHYQLLNHY